MTVVDKRKLWNTDIKCPDEVADFMSDSVDMMSNAIKSIKRTVDTLEWVPPIFLYYEQRGKQNYVDASAIYGGNGSRGFQTAFIESREILTYNIREELDKFIDDKKRGEILSAFCKIEYCIDAIICIHEGVYEDEAKLKSVGDELTSETDSRFSTTNKKIVYLKENKLVEKSGIDLLYKAKKIRNNLAHQYLPAGDVGVSAKDLERYGSHVEAIDYIFNGAWFYAIKSFAAREKVVVDWLKLM